MIDDAFGVSHDSTKRPPPFSLLQDSVSIDATLKNSNSMENLQRNDNQDIAKQKDLKEG